MIRQFLLIGLGWLAISLSVVAGKPPVYTTSGSAVGGYDPVSYFTENQPIKGKADIAYKWNGASYFFSNEANRQLFAQNPEKYAPQYGGYCAFAVAQGATAPGDPTVWSVVDGKLYLNLSSGVKQMWSADITTHIQSANQNWPKLLK